MELYDAMRTTFAAREYTGEEISDEVLYEVLENARFAPSGGNRQGNRVIVVRDQATKDRLAELSVLPAKRYIAQSKAGETPWNAVLPTDVTAEEIEATKPPGRLVEPIRKASAVLVFIVDLKHVASMDQYLDRVGVISGASIYPFVWNVLLGLRQAGFGGTITTLAIAQEPELKALLGVPDDHAVSAVMPVGRPVKQLTKLRRRSVEEIALR
ncbi:MAG: nitroreductase family protein, partial [Alphaproteobacteria bacterium]|nr:nitroreductase family protein [Alphaproteobacteria bacterium]